MRRMRRAALPPHHCCRAVIGAEQLLLHLCLRPGASSCKGGEQMAVRRSLCVALLLALAVCSAAARLPVEYSLDGRSWSKAGDLTLALTVRCRATPSL